jgi:hypothetical protein
MRFRAPSRMASGGTSTRGEEAARGVVLPRYLISFGARAMDHIPEEEIPAVTDADPTVGN